MDPSRSETSIELFQYVINKAEVDPSRAGVKFVNIREHISEADAARIDAALSSFHTKEYLDMIFIQENGAQMSKALKAAGLGIDRGDDCPIFHNMDKYIQRIVGGVLAACDILVSKTAKTAVFWGGGMHHGHTDRASGFCYTNDLVIAITELRKNFRRVLYVDIDIHHGDGVEAYFIARKDVMTLSIHMFESIHSCADGGQTAFFPGTGKERDIGRDIGKYFATNIPLARNISGESYVKIIEGILPVTFTSFAPDAVVLQCGCDSVAGDSLGMFNMSIRQHGR